MAEGGGQSQLLAGITSAVEELVRLQRQQQLKEDQLRQQQAADGGGTTAGNAEAEAFVNAKPGFVEDDPSTWGNPGRNDDCPCGSGKKFKHCHGRLA